jgi:lysophospholipase L1-like esterase
MRSTVAVLLCVLFVSAPAWAADQPFAWKDGDKVALIGGTVIEREQNFGYWEAALTQNIPAKNVTFRNLGWSGDTVWAESRGIFEPSDSRTPIGDNRGYGRLIELVKEQKPSVLIFGYGAVEAFAGAPGIPAFIQQYEKIISDCKAGSTEGARVILLSPMELVAMQPPLPPPTAANEKVRLYQAAIQDLSKKIGATYVTVSIPTAKNSDELLAITDNGQHLRAEGYARSASQLVEQLTPGKVKDLKTGDADSFRELIQKKNELFFHRHRPQNVTYLFLFRKHEQGNNAVDIPKFDPLVAELEQQISKSVD